MKTERETVSKTLHIFKKLDDGKSKNKNLSVNFSHILFSLFDFLTFEDWSDRFRNINDELPLCCAISYMSADLT